MHPERLQKILQQISQYLEEEVYPLERKYFHMGFEALLPELRELREQVKEMGFWAPHLSINHGGMGLSLLEFAQLSEVLGQSPLGHYLFNCQAPDIGNMEVLIKYGSETQKQKFFQPLANGISRSCFAMTEPQYSGSNPTRMGTTAVRDGTDYLINGRKWFTSGADGAAFAIAMVVTSPRTEKRHMQASQIIVPMDIPGLKVVRNISVMGERGSDYASHSEIIFDNCRVPTSHLLGAEGAGFVISLERLIYGRIHHCMRWIGICERAFDLMCRRAISRKTSDKEVLADSDLIRTWIAECRIEINATRALVLSVADKIDRQGVYASQEDVSIIKVHTANVLQKVLDHAIQLHGALGMTDDTPLAYWYRHERAAKIYDGPDEIHKKAIAKSSLRKYGFPARRKEAVATNAVENGI